MPEVTIIKRDRMAHGVGKSEVHHYNEALAQVDDHFDAHPEGYVELVFADRTRYAFYAAQAYEHLRIGFSAF